MKKTFLPAAIMLFSFLRLNAQVPKYALFEEFTQASCGPCGQYNPGFQKSILQKNPSTVREISYHTSWPGVDPMYNYNTSQSNSRVSYYGVTGVPDVFLMGNYKQASPPQMTQDDVNTITAETSPIKIKVTDEDNGTTHTVTVVVLSVGTPPTGTNWKLRTVIIERNVNYSTAPGSNGEKYFPNVFRKMLPSTSGDPITFAPMGSADTFTYTYTEDPVWNMSEIGEISFVQDDNTQAIENCGSSFDPDAYMPSPAILTSGGSMGTQSSFDVSTTNHGDASETFKYALTNNAPPDWTSDFSIDGNTYSDSTDVSIDVNENKTATIHVTPGSTAAVGTYTLTVTNLNDPNDDPVSQSVYVISGVTDLIVNGPGGQGAGSGETPTDWEGNYVNGIAGAGCTSSGILNSDVLLRANTENSLGGIKYIYYNVGWSFPAFTDDIVAYFETFLNAGGDLFLSGQDIGWDVWTPAGQYGNATPASQDFYSNYLNASWIADGDNSNSQLTPVPSDPIFGALSSMTILHHYQSYFYPDQIAAVGIGIPVFDYNSNSSKVSGIRADNGTYKIVYIAPGMEMFTLANATSILTRTYDWFHGIISGVNEVQNESLGNSYPNPADDYAVIPVNGAKDHEMFSLFNALGQLVMKENLTAGTSSIQISTSQLPQGIYHYSIGDRGAESAHALVIAH